MAAFITLFFSLLFIISGLFFSYESGTICLVLAQAILLLGFIQEKHVTSVGAFTFMSFLFFGMRPLHILLEKDLDLFSKLFHLAVDEQMLLNALWWATAGLWTFAVGVSIQRIHGKWSVSKLVRLSYERMLRDQKDFFVSTKVSNIGLISQVFTMIAMMVLAGYGRDIYSSSLGAYAYDFPMVLQGTQVFGIAVALERWRGKKGLNGHLLLGFSFLMLLITSWLAREVTIFRGAYITPIMMAGLCLIFRYRGHVSYIWLIMPLVILLPVFRTIGEARYLANEDAKIVIVEQITEALSPSSYWRFFDSGGDMNIFDTFVAANEWEPSKKPYLMSWLYIPMHLIPRKLWESKPEKGALQDIGYMYGAPYCPGIAGFFLGDGGRIWMICCMFVLGFILSWIDMKIIKLRPGYYKICCYGIFVINGLYLTRFFLWAYFYQVLYFLLPCLILSKILSMSKRRAINLNV